MNRMCAFMTQHELLRSYRLDLPRQADEAENWLIVEHEIRRLIVVHYDDFSRLKGWLLSEDILFCLNCRSLRAVVFLSLEAPNYYSVGRIMFLCCLLLLLFPAPARVLIDRALLLIILPLFANLRFFSFVSFSLLSSVFSLSLHSTGRCSSDSLGPAAVALAEGLGMGSRLDRRGWGVGCGTWDWCRTL